MSVTLTCYGGAGEIGGNKVLLEDGETRLFFDFGIPFGRQQKFFNEYLRPRAARGLLDLLALDLIPPLEGLYREDLALPGLWERFRRHPQYRNLHREGRAPVDAVFVSHAHLDHNGDLSYLDPAIPIYSSRCTAFIARAMQVTGQSSFERELTYINPRYLSESGELQSDKRSNYKARCCAFLDGCLSEEAKAFWERSPVSKQLEPAHAEGAEGTAGGLRFRWWPVDHSVPGAAGFAVETSAGWVGYTGDIRFHGRQAGESRRFVEELAALRPVALLCEGTHLERENPMTEADVVENALVLAKGAGGRLAIADFGPRNVERLASFLEIAEETGRWLVVQPKDLYLLKAIALADAFPEPASLQGLFIYADPKAAPRPWERALREEWHERTVGPDEVSARPGDYILCFSLWDTNDLLDLQGVEEGIYLYSNSRAYDDEQAADLERLRNWVKHMGLQLYGDPDKPETTPLHASGHASGEELVEMVKKVKPQILIPIHTESPELWIKELHSTGIEVHIPERGRAFHL
ncbi:MAG: MBL fold metallo-hydrolase [Anaerolineae bacterium]